MNNFTKIFIVILLCFSTLNTTAQKFDNPSDYLTFVGDELEVIAKNNWKYTKAIAHSKNDKNIASKRKVLLKSVERAFLKVQKAEGYDGDEYKNQVLKHLTFNKNILNNDYAEILDMKAIAEQSYDLMEAYILAQELADEKMEQAQAEYESNFYAFAKKHDINIIESDSDLSKKMKISGEVFNHYNALYLIFFKVYINEIYLMEALEKNDISAIQQNTNALSQSAKEGLTILENATLYKNDASIVNATKEIFNFFIDEADNKMPQQLDFLVLNDDMETISNTLEKTPEKKRTKKQIDDYNEKVKQINKAIKNYNKVNTELNNNRQKAFNALDITKDKFLDKHIPKD
ncbi:hypothetical protein KO494_11315 [Lacinutrix sp. C3R15]|uniref:hypothetical protein n=1 Tax=Flavobacteriaceae TaxID=49546 RepID=UPI001C0A140D|nr:MULTISPECIES: hypothetical protein [Flavobacteriaceae]MBU2940127.1 hypothetical protein [Lacinutrix sp. C3R15]MDO6623444.1 hypothetical protein [Oceanihabitans sp. 1_MG-2023]